MDGIKVGNIELDLILDAELPISGDAVFHPARRDEWMAVVPGDDLGEFIVPVRPLLIREPEGTTLVDTGFGDIAADENGVEERGNTRAVLETLGVAPDSVNRVIITHAHGDHMQGNTIRKGGEIVSAYKNAEFVIQRPDAENLQSESPQAWTRYFEPIAAVGKLKVIDGDTRLTPSILCTLTRGHTIGHQSVIITSGGESACYLGDLALHKLNLDRPEWGPDWAWSKEHDRENRIRIKEWARETGGVLILPHDAEHPFVTVE